jgi:hypothetical protein
VDEDFDMIVFEVKDRDPKFTWEIVRICRALNEDMRAIESMTNYLGNIIKHYIVGGDLNGGH